ncbi:MAG: hypothetical protein WA766_05360, partial [Candidatus Acidiferrales bacterium]
MKVTYMDRIALPPLANKAQVRTVSAWGEDAHRNLVRIRGRRHERGQRGRPCLRSSGATGFEDVMLIDFD